MNKKVDTNKSVETSNFMSLKLSAKAGNEAFARTCVAAFAAKLDPSLDQIDDIKTAVSEAVTNSIVHAQLTEHEYVTIEVLLKEHTIHITVVDEGVGIADIHQAMKPFFTTKSDQERSGLGFTLMGAFMDSLDVITLEKGLAVKMTKNIANSKSA